MFLKNILFLLSCLLFSTHLLATPNIGRIPSHEVSYFVQDLQTGEILAQHNANQAMNPASVMKLVTAYAALDVLGQDFSWQTWWFGRANIENGVLNGNLYWRGSGDPTLEQNDIIEMQQQLQQQGIRKIGGKIILDRSHWTSIGSAENFDSDEGKSFTIAPDTHMLSYKVVRVIVKRNEQGALDVGTIPPLVNTPIEKNVSFSGGRCNLNRSLYARYNGNALVIKGNIPAACENQWTYVNMLTAQELSAESFIGNWQSIGGSGSPLTLEGATPDDAILLASHKSEPLKNVIRTMNKMSDNLIARSLFLTLGNNPDVDTIEYAQQTVKNSLKQSGINVDVLELENGSGLSRSERVSAKMLGTMLYRAYFAPFGEEFIDSLPIAGVDGTLKRRLRDVPNLKMKTGTLKNVRALAGYKLPDNESEHPLAIVVIINSPQSSGYLYDMDNLVRSLANLSRNT